MIRILIQTQSPDPGSAGPPLIQVPLGFNPVWSEFVNQNFSRETKKRRKRCDRLNRDQLLLLFITAPPPPELSTPLPEEKPDTCSSAADSGPAVLVLFFKTLKETLNFNNKLIKFSQESIYWFNLFSSEWKDQSALLHYSQMKQMFDSKWEDEISIWIGSSV